MSRGPDERSLTAGQPLAWKAVTPQTVLDVTGWRDLRAPALGAGVRWGARRGSGELVEELRRGVEAVGPYDGSCCGINVRQTEVVRVTQLLA